MNSFVVFAFLMVATHAAYMGHGTDGGYQHAEYDDHHAPSNYGYEYNVHDSHTGDIKSAHETRHGGVVKGFYTLKEADGTTREVHYTADDHNGFNAEVKKIGHPVHYEHKQPVYQHLSSPHY